MMGTSYNGTIPIAAATTGVQGLEAIVPVAAISDWYDYYRANGLVRAPHSAKAARTATTATWARTSTCSPSTRTRASRTRARAPICWPILDEITAGQDRVSGNRNATWDERNYMKDADKIKAATLLVHGNNDFNVMTKNAAQL